MGKEKITIDVYKAIAIERGGRCLSDSVSNSKEKLLWECKFGHQWLAQCQSITVGHWCPHCGGTARKTISDMMRLAKIKNGKCMSQVYKNSHSKLEWECALGHSFYMKPYCVYEGQWCPICSKRICERITRYCFEKIFNVKFESIRPSFLENPKTGRNLELDGFNSDLNIAFEYNGQQHYKDNTLFSRSQNDTLKMQLCKDNNIKLYVIKFINNSLEYDSIIDQIYSQSDSLGIIINKLSYEDFNLGDMYSTNTSSLILDKIKLLAIDKNCICLSTEYIDSYQKLSFLCKICNRSFSKTSKEMKAKTPCSNCIEIRINKNKKILKKKISSFDLFKNKCILFNIDIIKYDSNEIYLKCNFNHEWIINFKLKRKIKGCPICSRINTRNSIEDAIELASKKEGFLISKEYIGVNNLLEWKCKFQHIWQSTFKNIKGGRWCPECSGRTAKHKVIT